MRGLLWATTALSVVGQPIAADAQALVDRPYVVRQTQQQTFSVNSIITTGQSDTQNVNLNFNEFKAPKYTGKLTSLAVAVDYRVDLVFNATVPSKLGDNWPIAYQFAFNNAGGYTAGSLGTPTRTGITYQCFFDECSTGGEPAPVLREVFSRNIDEKELGLKSLLGRAGGPLTVTTTAVMGGSLPAVLSSTMSGTVTTDAIYSARFPQAAKQKAEKLAVELGILTDFTAALGVVVNPLGRVTRTVAFIADQAIQKWIGEYDKEANLHGGERGYTVAREVAGAVGRLVELISQTAIPTNPASAFLTTAGLTMTGMRWIAQEIVKDPPDSRYQDVLDQTAPVIAGLRELAAVSPAMAKLVDVIEKIQDGTAELAAVLAAMERAQGAAEAGADIHVLQQLASMSENMEDFFFTTQSLASMWDDLFDELERSGALDAEFEDISGEELYAGLSDDVLDELLDHFLALGLSEDDFNDTLDDLRLRTFAGPTADDWAYLRSVGRRIGQAGDLTGELQAAQVPEPGTLGLLLVALAAAVVARRRSHAFG